ncbi:Similar to tRNA pseudouridine synthase C, group TruC1 [hydrothermal vent metagenome]|uniref:Similar to tRNA pseudouridine synthase C, group TruC1 n=1 Tax=hydrothermal vent metagenome TaxID=652676 RepID=A0A3B0U5F6_9ZZZZ
MSDKLPLEKRILFEDNHLVVVNKMPSEIVQGDKTGDEPMSELLKRYLKEKYHKPGNVFLGVVHRIDRPVSGVIVFAKTGKALSRMNELVKQRMMQKTYWAIVKNRPPQNKGMLVHYLVRDQKKNKSFVSLKPGGDRKEAILNYELLASGERYHLIEVDLHTGRHHQIRAQLATIGCPIKGDLKYGFPRSNPDASISLHARKVSFVHPVKKEMLEITADPPSDVLWDYFLKRVVFSKK